MPIPLNELFSVIYGSKLDLNKMKPLNRSIGGVNFVGRSSRNHGVSAVIEQIEGLDTFPAGSISVALGGSKLLCSFVQPEPFYTAQNVAVLQPLKPFTHLEKIFICLCIKHNRPRYSAFGREANRTLRTLLVPDRSEFPAWLYAKSLNDQVKDFIAPANQQQASLPPQKEWRLFRLDSLFELKKGKRLTQSNMTEGTTPFVASVEFDNGRRGTVGEAALHPAGCITVSYNGSIGEAFYQPDPFFASDDVNVLYPKYEMDQYVALFLCAVIRKEKYRFSYGRKWNLERMRATSIMLPAIDLREPNIDAMREYIKSLPFSSSIGLSAASSPSTAATLAH